MKKPLDNGRPPRVALTHANAAQRKNWLVFNPAFGGLLYLVVSQSTSTTDGVDLSEAYIIDTNAWDVMTESFFGCEASVTSAQAAAISSLAQQAAAQGITYVVAAGDSGSAGCDDPNTETVASHPVSVNVLAATPYTVAVGGTMFNESGHDSTYWKSTNAQATQESAISYIPEDVWNESCQSGQSGCSKGSIWAGGGGTSQYFAKPSWQAGVSGIPSTNSRALPDVSLTAASHDPYLLCVGGSCASNAQGQISFLAVSGTSAAAPAFAGIMALVGQKNDVRLGQPNFVLYRLAASENLSQCNGSKTSTLPASTCVFNDVTVGNNAVPGETGYGTTSATYQNTVGYDQASGLGSVNVSNLISQWNSVTFNPTTTAFSITPTSGVHGSPLNVTVKVSPTTGTGIPTGTVWLLQSGYPQGNFVGDNTADTFTLDSTGSFNGVTHLLPGGTYQVNTHYAGDGTYGGSDSSPAVTVAIQPEPTSLTFSVLTKDASGNLVPFTSGPYGTPVYFQAHLSWSSGYGIPSSYVNFWDNSSGISQANVDKNGNALSLPNSQIPAGNHSITAGYYGDNSFAPSPNLTPINFNIGQVSTNTTLTSQQTAQSLLLTVTVSGSSSGAPPSGMVTFSNGSSVLGTVSLSAGRTSNGTVQATAVFDASQLAPGQYSVTASYAGDTNYAASTSTPVALNLTADFSVANRGITTQTVVAGQVASYINDIGVTPFFGFSGTVNLSCSIPAAATNCSVNPSSIPDANGIASMSITTTARTARIPIKLINRSPFDSPIWVQFITVLLLGAILIICAKTRRRTLVEALVLALLLLVLGMTACGGGSMVGSGGGGGTPQPQSGTAAGNYTVTVTATSGTTTHTTMLTLVVQ
jgi:hypothetical protein